MQRYPRSFGYVFTTSRKLGTTCASVSKFNNETNHTKTRKLGTTAAKNSASNELIYTPIKEPLKFDASAFEQWPKHIILRNWSSFMICQFDFITRNSPKIMNLGNHRFNPLRPVFQLGMRHTVYNQFVGGDTDKEIAETCESLEKYGIEPMLAIPMETENIVAGQDISLWHEVNLTKMLDSIRAAAKFAIKFKPAIHVKVTGIMHTELFLKISDHIGLDIFESSSKQKFEDCVQEFINLMENPDLDTSSSYFSNFLSEKELKHLKTGAARVKLVGEKIAKEKTQVLIDAEYININPAITVMTLALARLYNTPETPYIWNTYQCYLKNTPKLVDYEIEYLTRHKVSWGAKIVRGAYMASERTRAKQGGYPDPVCDDIQATHDNYNGVITSLIERYGGGEKIQFLVASHNEETIKLAVDQLKEVEKSGKVVWDDVIFGQLYGMCDHISSSLAKNGAPVYKSMPIGALEDVMPYLARRAQENQTVLAGAHRERKLLWDALMKNK